MQPVVAYGDARCWQLATVGCIKISNTYVRALLVLVFDKSRNADLPTRTGNNKTTSGTSYTIANG